MFKAKYSGQEIEVYSYDELSDSAKEFVEREKYKELIKNDSYTDDKLYIDIRDMMPDEIDNWELGKVHPIIKDDEIVSTYVDFKIYNGSLYMLDDADREYLLSKYKNLPCYPYYRYDGSEILIINFLQGSSVPQIYFKENTYDFPNKDEYLDEFLELLRKNHSFIDKVNTKILSNAKTYYDSWNKDLIEECKGYKFDSLDAAQSANIHINLFTKDGKEVWVMNLLKI